jgi:hypothetical protein
MLRLMIKVSKVVVVAVVAVVVVVFVNKRVVGA